MLRLRVRVRVRVIIRGMHFHKPTHSASTHNERTQVTTLVGLDKIMPSIAHHMQPCKAGVAGMRFKEVRVWIRARVINATSCSQA